MRERGSLRAETPSAPDLLLCSNSWHSSKATAPQLAVNHPAGLLAHWRIVIVPEMSDGIIELN